MSTVLLERKKKKVSEPERTPGIQREADGRLTFTPAEGDPVKDCRVARCFPWSMPDRFISIRDKDGNEVKLYASVPEIPEHSRAIVLEELGVTEFIPEIRSVENVDDTFEIQIWTVDTDRGLVEFQVKDDEDIRAVGEDRVVIKDHNGMLFEISTLSALDEGSRALIEDRL